MVSASAPAIAINLSVMPALQLKMGSRSVPAKSMPTQELSEFVNGRAGIRHDVRAPLGRANGFAHKGRMHVPRD